MSSSSQNQKMTVIAGPCVIEDEALVNEVADSLQSQFKDLNIDFFFKASFDKANRSSISSFRGPGLKRGLEILAQVKERTGLKILTDFHYPEQAEPVAEVVDFLQIPAFLCRQTDMITAGAKAAIKNGCRLNVKKGQFLAPWDTRNIIDKVGAVAEQEGVSSLREFLCLTERGTSFGYNTLVVDFSGILTMQRLGVPVIYDATHSIQVPAGSGGSTQTGGKREALEPLARAAMAAGADGVFFECHPDPSRAKSDAANALYLEYAGDLVRHLLAFRKLNQETRKLLPESQ